MKFLWCLFSFERESRGVRICSQISRQILMRALFLASIILCKNCTVSCSAVVPEWLRGLTRNQLHSVRIGSNPIDGDIFFKILSNYKVSLK